jgi:type IV pilus assembly protein PilM
MAFTTIWSLDLGKAALKAVKLRRDRNSVEILAIDKVDYPLSGNGADVAQAKEAIGIFKARNEVRDPVVVAHPGQGTFSRFIKVPAFDQKKVKDMVRYEASQQIPFPLDEVIWDYHIVDRDYSPGEEREIGLFAVRRETIDDYLLDFTREGLSVEMLSIGYLGLLNFIKYDLNPQEPAIVLDIGAAHTDLILVDAQRFWIRPLPHSGNDITKAIMSRFKLDFAEAEKLKIETTKAPQQAAKIFQAVIQPKLQELVQEVHRSVGYYKSQVGDVKFSRLYLLGNGSRIIGIKKFLEDHLGLVVERIQSIRNLRVNRDVNLKLLQAELAAFGTALGCGIQAVGAGTCQVDLVPREEKLKKEAGRKKKHVFIAAGILAVCILASYFIIQGKVQSVGNTVKASSDLMKAKLDEKGVRTLRDVTQTDLTTKIEDVKTIAEARQGSLEGLRALESVLAALPRSAPPEITVAETDQAGVQKARQEVEAALANKLWIPYLGVELVEWSQAGEVAAKAAGAGKAKAKGALPTVPAYKFRAIVMIKARESQSASTEAIRAMLERPLQKALELKQLTVKHQPTVTPSPESRDLIFFDPGRKEAQGAGPGGEEVKQEGGPFFEAEVVWYMVPRDPPEPPKEAPPPEKGDDEKPPPKRPPRQPKK